MIRCGFIRTKDEIKFLILTCMSYLPFPVSFDSVVDICTWCDDGFDYFELTEAFSELEQTGHITKASDNPDLFSISEKGRETARMFCSRLPFTVREAAEMSALRVIRQLRRDAQISADTEKIGDKDYIVNLSMDGVFSLKMNVVSKSQASLLTQNFKKNADKIYQELLAAMTKDYDETE